MLSSQTEESLVNLVPKSIQKVNKKISKIVCAKKL